MTQGQMGLENNKQNLPKTFNSVFDGYQNVQHHIEKS